MITCKIILHLTSVSW